MRTKLFLLLLSITVCNVCPVQAEPDDGTYKDYERFLKIDLDTIKDFSDPPSIRKIRKPAGTKSGAITDADDSASTAHKPANYMDDFSGSEFQTPTFMDADFGRHSYRDDFRTRLYSDRSDRDRIEDQDRDRRDDSYRKLTDVDRRRIETWKEITSSTADLIGDWVPSTPDPTSNGAFGLGADNGAPVPYNLNGHPDPERKLPWAKGN